MAPGGQILVGYQPLPLGRANRLGKVSARAKRRTFATHLNEIGQIAASGGLRKRDAVFLEGSACDVADLDGQERDTRASVADSEANETRVARSSSGGRRLNCHLTSQRDLSELDVYGIARTATATSHVHLLLSVNYTVVIAQARVGHESVSELQLFYFVEVVERAVVCRLVLDQKVSLLVRVTSLLEVELELLAAILDHLLDGKLLALADRERQIERHAIRLPRVDQRREQPVLDVL